MKITKTGRVAPPICDFLKQHDWVSSGNEIAAHFASTQYSTVARNALSLMHRRCGYLDLDRDVKTYTATKKLKTLMNKQDWEYTIENIVSSEQRRVNQESRSGFIQKVPAKSEQGKMAIQICKLFSDNDWIYEGSRESLCREVCEVNSGNKSTCQTIFTVMLNRTSLLEKLAAQEYIASQELMDVMQNDDWENTVARTVVSAALERTRRYPNVRTDYGVVESNKQVDSLQKLIHAVGQDNVHKVTIEPDGTVILEM
ncbi:MAG: hypothetical protein CME33_04290 [Gimesia sp.]|uniref:hypothetical protein n=1 Tax=Gimesia sp. TaxID=2024833 RepID=UPI000C532F31|nr:hypothetical protein [Gimesia sp.]MAX35772.1 hypothetical protein [Gimesia sp.]|tara:strand:+ start:5335 stop:6102 length:768 start_codon:yes stop_codon:yes gene_type:complete